MSIITPLFFQENLSRRGGCDNVLKNGHGKTTAHQGRLSSLSLRRMKQSEEYPQGEVVDSRRSRNEYLAKVHVSIM